MWMQHADTRPFGSLARYPVALALAAALSAAQLATPVLAQQNRPAAQPSADAPRNPAAGGETGARPTPARNENAMRLPADSTTEHVVELPGRKLAFKATAGSIPLTHP